MRRVLMLLMLLTLVGCPTGANDDDATANDDDATANDDDATANDDDATADDDDATGDDDDATANDDDATADDDDATANDDDSAGDDDDATADDDDSAGDDDDATADDDDSAGDDDDSAGDGCADRTGGAVITLQTGADSFSFWSTNSSFIDDCISNLGTNGWYVMLGNPVTPGDCDSQWSWTVPPAFGSLGNSAPFNPVCIATASQVEANVAYYQQQSAGWCPSAGIVAVSDQR